MPLEYSGYFDAPFERPDLEESGPVFLEYSGHVDAPPDWSVLPDWLVLECLRSVLMECFGQFEVPLE